MLKKYFGDKAFYKRIFALAIPIMVQNAITNFVNMLDNVMVGQIGTVEMTGVAISNQLMFVFNLCIFGALSGAGIFSAQFFGKSDNKGVRETFRFKVLFGGLLTLIGILIFLFFSEPLVSIYLKGEGSPADAAAALKYAKDYIKIMLIGLLPYTLVQCYSSTLRETDRPTIAMIAGVSAVFINLILNYILIFGKFGAPKLGVKGAAIATVISRFAELLIVALYTAINKKDNPFIIGAFKSVYVPFKLIKQITIKGLPLMLNETLWAAGMATVNSCYSLKGLNVVAANNISQTFFNVFAVAFMSVGVSAGIILGQLLGANKKQEAKSASRKLIMFSCLVSVVIGIIYFFCAEFIPFAYNTSADVRHIATRLMQITALAFPIDAFSHAAYFTLRSGGKTFLTMLFDCCFIWVVNVPAALLLCYFTSLNILYIFAIIQLLGLIKCVLGYIFVKKGVWIKNIVVS